MIRIKEKIYMNTTNQNKTLKFGIILLTVITIVIHLVLAVARPDPTFTPLFLLNAAGYIGLLILYLLPPLRQYQGLIRWLFIGYTGVTIAAYFIANAGNYNAFGIADKVVEVLLIVLLYLDRK